MNYSVHEEDHITLSGRRFRTLYHISVTEKILSRELGEQADPPNASTRFPAAAVSNK
jgi:hypothetical protein